MFPHQPACIITGCAVAITLLYTLELFMRYAF